MRTRFSELAEHQHGHVDPAGDRHFGGPNRGATGERDDVEC